MGTLLKNLIIMMTIVILAVALAITLFFYVARRNTLSPSGAELFLRNNTEQLFLVRDYLLSVEFTTITIRAPNHSSNRPETNEIEMFAGLEHGVVLIEDEAVIEALRHLFPYTRQIRKRENAINFLLWSVREHGRGIVYTIDGDTPNESVLTFLTHIEPLSEESWFFYVENFNEWRRNQN